jgi:spore coat polysaccharide biosynthesis protein SpsF
MINATVEVRMTSSRLPGKPLMKAAGKTMLEILITRLSQSKHIQSIIVATTINKQDDPIIDYCIENNICYYRGSENNVLERVYNAAVKYNTDLLVQITGDCPLIDYRLVDGIIDVFLENYPKTRFASNTGPNITMPWGFDVQVYKAEELRMILEDSPSQEDKEHVSNRFYHEEFQSLYNPEFIKYTGVLNRPELRVTLDYIEDYDLIREIVEDFGLENLKQSSMLDIINWLDSHSRIRDLVIEKHKNG